MGPVSLPSAPRLLVLGDSVTVGEGFAGVTRQTSYFTRLAHMLAERGAQVDLLASAIEGVDTSYAVRRFARMVTAHDPDAVLILLGLNDVAPPGNRPAASCGEFQQNLLGLIDRVLSIDAKPLLATPNPRFALDDQGPGVEWLAPYVERTLEVAAHHQLLCVDLYHRYLEHGGVESLIPDGIHPGPEGHRLMAGWLAEALAPVFGGRSVLAPDATVEVRG